MLKRSRKRKNKEQFTNERKTRGKRHHRNRHHRDSRSFHGGERKMALVGYHSVEARFSPANGEDQVADAISGQGFCPLCRKHCSLSAPSCRKGEQYAASFNANRG